MAIVALSVVVFSDIGEVCQVVCILTCAMDVADFVFADQFLAEKDDHKLKAIFIVRATMELSSLPSGLFLWLIIIQGQSD